MRLFGLERGYPLVPLFSYTPIVCLAALAVTGICALLRQWPATVTSGLAALALIAAVAPRTLGGPSDADGRPLRVLSANVFRGQGDERRLLQMLRERDVDVFAVQELTSKAAADLSGLGIRRLLPHAQLSVQEGVKGSGIYSRHPIRAAGATGELDFKQTRAAISVAPGLLLDTVSVHPEPPRGPHSIDEWRAGLAALPAANERGTQLLLGDFNATLDHAELRELIDTGYADSADRMGEGLSMTWPADRSWPPEVAIDHVLVERSWAVRDFEVLELPGSDHRPVYADLAIPSHLGP